MSLRCLEVVPIILELSISYPTIVHFVLKFSWNCTRSVNTLYYILLRKKTPASVHWVPLYKCYSSFNHKLRNDCLNIVNRKLLSNKNFLPSISCRLSKKSHKSLYRKNFQSCHVIEASLGQSAAREMTLQFIIMYIGRQLSVQWC